MRYEKILLSTFIATVFLSVAGLGAAEETKRKPSAQANDLAQHQRFDTRQRACARYAQAAVMHQRENQRFACGYVGLFWHANYNGHYNWCMSAAGRNAGAAARNRQFSLRHCRVRKVCTDYAKTALRQFSVAQAANCGFRPPRWSGSYAYHYNWCRRLRDLGRARAESWRRRAELNRCRATQPLDGDFRVVKVRPSLTSGGIVERLTIVVEATSNRPWRVGTFGHKRFGSFWAEVTLTRVYPAGASVRRQSRTYLFSIRGRPSGTLGFVRPRSGTAYPAGRARFTVIVAPWPRFRLNGVQTVFGRPGGLLSPGSVGCHHYFPEVRVRVFIATTANVAKVRGTRRVIMSAPLCLNIVGGRRQIYQRCRKPYGPRC